jgi:hypothetical protein
MPAKEDLLKKLSQQKDKSAATRPEILAEWRKSLNELFRVFAEWLAEAVAENLLKVGEIPVEIQEEQLGSYDAPSLKIVTPQGVAVYIVPKARIVVGAYGRVDFECSPNRCSLVRTAPDRWQFSNLSPSRGGWSFEDLTEDSFWKVLQYLLS